MCHLMYPLLIFCLFIYVKGLWKLSIFIVFLSVSPFISVNISFIYFSSLIVMAGTFSKQCWLRMVRVDIFVFSSSKGKFFFLTNENYVCQGFVLFGLYYVEVFSLNAHFLESFYQKWVLNICPKFFLHLLSYDFYSQFVNMLYHLDWFAYIE